MNEWKQGEDGIWTRHAARIIIISRSNHTLVMEGHDKDEPGRHWLFTVGGGIMTGETPTAAAVRELTEEVGMRVPQTQLVGPVVRRVGIFDFKARTCRQYEQFFLLHVDAPFTPKEEGWTETESNVLDGAKWLTPTELRNQKIAVYPPELPDLVEKWSKTWDGEVVILEDTGR
ncbi:MAG: NUDIX domain-containing protein [Actinomycetaceae bacterium]|nr:NUDIX domain-containing protein [Actinomycetaceae bacterium]